MNSKEKAVIREILYDLSNNISKDIGYLEGVLK